MGTPLDMCGWQAFLHLLGVLTLAFRGKDKWLTHHQCHRFLSSHWVSGPAASSGTIAFGSCNGLTERQVHFPKGVWKGRLREVK